MSFHKNIIFSGSFLPAKICCINFMLSQVAQARSMSIGPRADLWPFYGFKLKRQKTVYIKTRKTARGPHRRDVTHFK